MFVLLSRKIFPPKSLTEDLCCFLLSFDRSLINLKVLSNFNGQWPRFSRIILEIISSCFLPALVLTCRRALYAAVKIPESVKGEEEDDLTMSNLDSGFLRTEIVSFSEVGLDRKFMSRNSFLKKEIEAVRFMEVG